MRTLTLLFCLISTVANARENVHLHGKITHRLSDSVSVSYAKTSIEYKPIEYAARLDKDGKFTLSFSVPYTYTLLRIRHGNQQTQLFVAPASDLDLTIDAANFDSSLNYTGNGSGIANFIALQHITTGDADELCGKLLQQSGKDPEAYHTLLDQELQKQCEHIDSNGNKLPASFIAYYKKYYRYAIYRDLLLYPAFHEIIKLHSYNVKHIPKENYKFIEEVPAAFDDKYLDMPPYQYYTDNYFQAVVNGQHVIQGDTAFNNYDTMLQMAYTLMPPKTADLFMGRYILLSSNEDAVDKTIARYDIYKKNFPHSPYLKIIEQKIALGRRMANGKPAIDIPITTPGGVHMHLTDLKGEVVLIDFWARSCQPCLAEMPPSKKVRDHFKGKPVAFVYVSLDKEDSVWKKAIQKYEVYGYNTRVENDLRSPLVKQYGVLGIPAYFLIDKNGNFASVGNLPRPSETEKLIEIIEGLLK